MADYDFDPRNLPQDLLAAIGLAVTASAQTESVVVDMIGGCLGIDVEYTAAIATHMSAPLRDSVLRSAAEIRLEDLDDLDRLDELLDEIKIAYDKRNTIVHHTWCRDPETGKTFIVKETARTRVEVQLVEMTVDQVKRDAMFIYLAGMNLQRFLSARGLSALIPSVLRPRGHKSKAARKARRKKLART
jgi:hypothetical protein